MGVCHDFDIGVRAPSGEVTSLFEKIRQYQSPWALKSGLQRTKIAVKTKTIAILTPYEAVIIPKIVILNPPALYDVDRKPQKLRWKKQWICPRTKVLWSGSKRFLSWPPQKQNSWCLFTLILMSSFDWKLGLKLNPSWYCGFFFNRYVRAFP